MTKVLLKVKKKIQDFSGGKKSFNRDIYSTDIYLTFQNL